MFTLSAAGETQHGLNEQLRHTRNSELIQTRTKKFPRFFVPYSLVRDIKHYSVTVTFELYAHFSVTF